MDHVTQSSDALMNGMFWGGLLVAAVPMLLSFGIAIYVLRRYMTARRQESHDRTS